MPLPVAAAMLGSAAIGAAGSLFSGKQSADFAEESYKHRYQWMVKDLQKAGLNPMLAVQQGAGNVPQAQFPNAGEGAVKGASAAMQARLLQAQAENTKADTELKGSATALNIANTRSAAIQAGISEASLPYAPMLAQATAVGADKHIAFLQTQINEIAERTRGHKLSNDQLERMQPILLETQRLINAGMSADLVRKNVYGRLWSIVPDEDTVDGILDILKDPGSWPRRISEWGKEHGYESR